MNSGIHRAQGRDARRIAGCTYVPGPFAWIRLGAGLCWLPGPRHLTAETGGHAAIPESSRAHGGEFPRHG